MADRADRNQAGRVASDDGGPRDGQVRLLDPTYRTMSAEEYRHAVAAVAALLRALRRSSLASPWPFAADDEQAIAPPDY